MDIIRLSEPVHGWIEITFGTEPDSHTVCASDVPNDCLRDLAAAIVRLLAGSTDETIEFSLEPTFATCQLHRNLDSLHVVVKNPDPDREAPDFDATFPLRAFARRLKSELLRIESRYSDQNGWTQPFPSREVAKLSANEVH
jgi:hypothetical protein